MRNTIKWVTSVTTEKLSKIRTKDFMMKNIKNITKSKITLITKNY